MLKHRKDALKKLEQDVTHTWPLRKGKNEFLDHIRRQIIGDKTPITRGQAMLAMCYHCTGGFEIKEDCKSYCCPLYMYQPYRHAKARKEYTEEELAELRARMAKARETMERNKNGKLP